MRTQLLHAPLSRRLTAYLVDSLALFGGVLLTQAVFALASINPILRLMNAGQSFNGGQLHLWVFVSASVPFWLYYALMHSSGRGATVGKRLMGLRVVTQSGNRVSLGQGLIRAVVMLVPFEANHAVLFHLGRFGPESASPSMAFWLGYGVVWMLIAVYVLLAGLSPRRQGPHDLIAGTIVVQTNPTQTGVFS